MERDFQTELNLKIEAGIPIIQIISYEWRRILGFCVKAAKRESSRRTIYWWNKAWKIRKWDEIKKNLEPNETTDTVPEVLKWFNETMPQNSILIMEDVHLFYNTMKELIIDQIRIVARDNPENKKTLILAQPIPSLPVELEKDVYVMEIPLPTNNRLKTVIKEVVSELKWDESKIKDEDVSLVAEAGLGLTEIEAKYTYKEIGIEKQHLSKEEIPLIIERKEQLIKKSGILEYIHPKNSMKDVGGMENLKKWLYLQQKAFELEANEFGIEPPKGVLLLGVPGCGKSLIAKIIGADWNLPLLKFDIGKVFGGIVGESESNMRKALEISNAIAPCILWVDEIEKGLAGVSSSDKLDSGVTARVFGTLLTWMQEKEKPVFVVATANNISQIPAEFLRKGRFNEIFFVDLPGPISRKDIWEIHLKKRMKGRYDSKIFNYIELVEKSIFYSGAEIEEAVNMGLIRAYNQNREINGNDLFDSLKEIYPLSKTMADVIIKLRTWAQVRVRVADSEKVEDIPPEIGKDVPKLKQEHMSIPWVDEEDDSKR